MKRILLTVSYDGFKYHGFQIQNHSTTIEGILNETISKLTNENVEVIGASRTDTGVHALGNVVVFDTASTIPAEKFCYAINTLLPEDIIITSSYEVERDFHPRKVESIKTYEYTILNSKFNVPKKRGYVWHIKTKLDVNKMREAASLLVGRHDFRGFCSSKTQAKSTIRIIYSISIIEEKEEIKIVVRGNGFLYNMVRIIAGTLANVGGLGKITKEDVYNALISGDRTCMGLTAPPQGLCLLDIEFI